MWEALLEIVLVLMVVAPLLESRREKLSCFHVVLIALLLNTNTISGHDSIGTTARVNKFFQQRNVMAFGFVPMAFPENVRIRHFDLISQVPLLCVHCFNNVVLSDSRSKRASDPLIRALWCKCYFGRVSEKTGSTKSCQIPLQFYSVSHSFAEIPKREDDYSFKTDEFGRAGASIFKYDNCAFGYKRRLFCMIDSFFRGLRTFLGSFCGSLSYFQPIPHVASLFLYRAPLQIADTDQESVEQQEESGTYATPIKRRYVTVWCSLGLCIVLCWFGGRLIDRGRRCLGCAICGLGLAVFNIADILFFLSGFSWSCCWWW
jgi:hypothetical protein